MGNFLETLSDKSFMNLYHHNEYFTIKDFNEQYLKTFDKTQIDQFYTAFDFQNYILHKKAENQVFVDLLKVINADWIFQSPKIILLIKKSFFTFYFYEVAFQSNLNEYKLCLNTDDQRHCIQILNQKQLALYEQQREKMKFSTEEVKKL
ncbi:unnamed protein product [Paramecium octaurelia]|uniref:Uncharacterized protein n=1 Tax=Paramecium octaurelia TaxID=43137 RepID=A0A8S1W6J5_PAROT|nr:unnamed protein product [Paramecium octaurelia]